MLRKNTPPVYGLSGLNIVPAPKTKFKEMMIIKPRGRSSIANRSIISSNTVNHERVYSPAPWWSPASEKLQGKGIYNISTSSSHASFDGSQIWIKFQEYQAYDHLQPGPRSTVLEGPCADLGVPNTISTKITSLGIDNAHCDKNNSTAFQEINDSSDYTTMETTVLKIKRSGLGLSDGLYG